ncbi:non-specific lipid transfer protein GPI-anchored 16-like [Salvia splendens]|uniref:non-specific lipid transfer protein GPI-anchored 16-like n=1 Tax=Salvia splendens TaxID=180675 RepID=UPI001C257480|nr:non-specific lipid transfer protein GPI-anchored 16-like [Salvia splendens]
MASLILPIIVLILSSILKTNAQINTACSNSMISSFTPCLSIVAGSSPSRGCCDALKSLVENNMDCACLIITGNVPVSIPFINANLGSTLPRACKTSIPMHCKSSGVPLPAPGPVLFTPPAPPAPEPALPRVHVPASAPAPAPHHAHSPKGSKAARAAAPPPDGGLDIAPAAAAAPPPKFPLGRGANPGVRPVVNNNSSASDLFAVSWAHLILVFAGIIAI